MSEKIEGKDRLQCLAFVIGIVFMIVIAASALVPSGVAWASASKEWTDLELFAIESYGNEEYAGELRENRLSMGRDYTEQEKQAIRKGIEAQGLYESISDEVSLTGREFTSEELKVFQEAVEVVFGSQSGNLAYQSSDGMQLFADVNRGGGWSPGIGVYPVAKGKILVTNDWYKGLIPTGHAGIVSARDYVVESLSDGVVLSANTWYQSKNTVFGLDVKATNETTEARVADWCRSQIGKPYNYNYLNTGTYASFYCSQLVWRGYLDVAGVNMNTSEYDVIAGTHPVHPMELVHSDKTTLVYRQGTAETGWNQINGEWYYIDSKGNPLVGYYKIGNANYLLSPPSGAMAPYILQSGAIMRFASMLNTGKVIDVPGASVASSVQLQIYQNNGTDAQRFYVWSKNGQDWYIANVKSGLYLDVQGASVSNGTPIQQYPFNGTNAQKWRLVKYSNGFYAIVSKLNTNYCIDVTSANTANGTKLQLYRQNGTNAQRFWLY